jgi:hypothetical protein
VSVGEIRNIYKILVGKPERRAHLVDLYVDGKIILKWVLNSVLLLLIVGNFLL